MKIAMIAQPVDRINREGGESGSVAIITRQLARHLASDHNVAIYATRQRGHPEEEIDVDGIRIRRIRSNRKFHELALRLNGAAAPSWPYFVSRAFYGGFFRRLAEILPSADPDVVHFHSLPQHAPELRAALPRAKLVLHMHGDSLTRIDRAAASRQLEATDLVIGVSDFVTRGIQERLPEVANRCITVHNGVDTNRFHPASADPRPDGGSNVKRLLFVGRISPEKGVHVLLEAFERVLEKHPNTELDLIGPEGQLPFIYLAFAGDKTPPASLRTFYGGTLVERLNRQILQPGNYLARLLADCRPETTRRIRWHGVMTESKLCHAYRQANIFVFPSLWNEAFGMPVAEAMASGLPAVVARSGPLPDLVGDGVCGLVVDRDDSVSLAHAVGRLLDNDELCRQMGTKARKRAENLFAWPFLAGQLSQLYAEIAR